MNEGEGNIVKDLTGKNNGTILNGTWKSGKYGKCYYLDASYANSAINLGSKVTPDGTLGIAVSFWVRQKITDFDNNIRIFIADNAGNPNTENGFWIAAEDRVGQGTNALRFAIDTFNANVRDVRVDNFFTNYDDKWVHVFVSYFPNNLSSFYRNGVKLTEAVITNGTGTFLNSKDENMYIGNLNNLSAQSIGYLDNFQIWNRALSESEIKSLYQAPYQFISYPKRRVYSISGAGPTETRRTTRLIIPSNSKLTIPSDTKLIWN